MKIKFEDSFLFGGSINGEQCEGRGVTEKALTIWDKFYQEFPKRFYNGVGPIFLNDFQNTYKSDVKLMAQAGIKILRFPIQWSRLMPDGKTISQENVEYYKNLYAECRKNGIKIIAPLHTFDTPLWAQEKGGFENPEIIKSFVNFAKHAFKIFANDVDYFVTFVEPTPMVLAGYLYGSHWPLVQDFKRAVQVGFNIILTHALCVNEFKKMNFKKTKIGAIFNNPICYPRNLNDKDDVEAATLANSLINTSFTNAMIGGEFDSLLIDFLQKNNLMPKYEKKDLEIIKKTKVQFLGINYYQPYRFKKKESAMPKSLLPESFFDYYSDPNARYNKDRGWEIYPKGIYDAAMFVTKKYPNIEFFITENGLSVANEERFLDKQGTVNDEYRIAFYKEHLYWLNKAINEGAKCKGYLIWSPIDNWSWLNGYKNRYGLIRVDLNNQERSFKKSAVFYKKISETKEFEWDENKEKCDEVFNSFAGNFKHNTV